jgi:hypothetical protein
MLFAYTVFTVSPEGQFALGVGLFVVSSPSACWATAELSVAPERGIGRPV